MTEILRHGYLKDSEGNRSSKRLWGSIILGIALLMAVALFIVYLIQYNYYMATQIMETLEYVGAGLLGIGIAEKLFKRGK